MSSFSITAPLVAGSEVDYAASVPENLRGRWIALWVAAPTHSKLTLWIEANAAPTDFPIKPWILRPFRQGRLQLAVLYVDPKANWLGVRIDDTTVRPTTIELNVKFLSKSAAWARLMVLVKPQVTLSALAGDPKALRGRLQDTLANDHRVPGNIWSYPLWVSLFDTWSEQRIEDLSTSAAELKPLRFLALVFHDASQSSTPLQATLDSFATSRYPIDGKVVYSKVAHEDLRNWADGYDYVAFLQAGEVFPPYAFAVASRFLHSHGYPAVVTADEDSLDTNGHRCDPVFKPVPNRALMMSGLLSRGLWLFRRDVLPEFSGQGKAWAETARLEAWFHQEESNPADVGLRIPHVLTHRRPDVRNAPPEAIAGIVSQHLARSGQTAEIASDRFPLYVRLQSQRPEKVTVVIPTAARNPHVLRCLTATLAKADWDPVEFVVVVSQMDELDDAQRRSLQPAFDDPRVNVLRCPIPQFNFSTANNWAIAQTESPFVCLLNDDIIPIEPDWLSNLMGNMADPRVAVVGAKLLHEI